MPPEKRVRINSPPVIHEIIDNEVVIIHFDTGNYYSLKGVGVDVWRFIEVESTLDEIISRIASVYQNGGDNIDEAISHFIDDLHKENLIEYIKLDSFSADSGNPHSTKQGLGIEKGTFVPPVLNKFTDMQELLLLDPIHEVDEAGWPSKVLDPRDD